MPSSVSHVKTDLILSDLRPSLEILSNKKNYDPKWLANAKNRLGLFYLEQGIYNKAETELEEALKIKLKEYGMNDIMLVTTLNHLGIFLGLFLASL